jgi:regulator of cell morphogenesis and NO signaling
LAEIITANVRLLDVLPCFGIGLGFGESTVKQVCDENGVSVKMFLLVCNVYAFEDYLPDAHTIEQIQITDILAYFSASYNAYRKIQRPKIIYPIIELTKTSSEQFRSTVSEFCKRYDDIILGALNYEEQVNFPYIQALLNGENPKKETTPYEEVSEGEQWIALSDLQNMLIKHMPDRSIETLQKYRDLLYDIASYDSMTQRHILLNHILAEKVERLIAANYDKS